MEFSIVEFVGSGSVSAQQVGEVFRAAWSPYVALFAGEPAVARMFAGYIDATVQSEFSSRAAFERAHVAARQRFFVALDARGAVVGHVAARLGSSCELWRMAVHPQVSACLLLIGVLPSLSRPKAAEWPSCCSPPCCAPPCSRDRRCSFSPPAQSCEVSFCFVVFEFFFFFFFFFFIS
jgi:hypothetical protein